MKAILKVAQRYGFLCIFALSPECMSMRLFYSSDIRDDVVILDDQEAQHCSVVLRKNTGDTVFVTDGLGHLYKTCLIEKRRTSLSLEILSVTASNLDFKKLPHLAIGILKNESRMEWLIEKLVEIGVRRITPVLCKRSEKKTIRRGRLIKYMIGAMKQSARLFLPTLDDPMEFDLFISESSSSPMTSYIAHYQKDNQPFSSLIMDSSATMLIGPEGDFSPSEVELAINSGYIPVNLGEIRLRSETAGITACVLLNQVPQSIKE